MRTRRALFAVFTVVGTAVALTAVAMTSASAGTIGTASGFEDDDGNLLVNSTFDWNGFASVTWTGSAPYQIASKTASGWQFGGFADAQAVTSDTAFAGGTKQDDNCPTVQGAKASNKDDLKRIYVSSKTVNGHVYLNLAWVRIPQNTTSPSAHVGFEFNQGTTACGGSSGSLVQRTAGDMLIVYDFEGGSSDTPTLTLRRWTTTGPCEVSSDSAPCWGVAVNLSASGFAEAKVNTTATASDTIGPSGTETLGLNEFGEAGIDLTAAGVFTANACAAFGKVSGVSRSSGNSGTAQMKDLVGPGSFNLANCGRVTIIKHTDPGGLNQNFGFTSTLAGAQISCTTDTTPVAFTLNDAATDTEDCTNVPAGSYTVTEGANPTGFVLESLTCVPSGTGASGSQDATNPKQANITVAANSTVTCTYVNQQQLGAIKITKTSSKGSSVTLAGATFSVTSGGNPITGSPFTTGSDGTFCVDNLPFGDYVVTETAAPTGYSIDTTAGQTITVNNNAKCSDSTFVGETQTFTDTPLTDLKVTADSEATGGTKSQITCVDSSNADVGDSPSGNVEHASVTANGLAPGTYTCTVVVDP